tara:strand:+ start:854 stop:1243 length:390 start_codon:yes stop_codon:yes gene_type:complete
MESFCAVTIQYLDIKNGENINNLILNKQLIYNVNKKKNSYTVDFLINNYDLDLNNLIYNNLGETFCIISENDYNSLIQLLYSDNKQLINYNNNYYIIEIESHFKFKGNENIVNNVRNKFLDKIKKNISN